MMNFALDALISFSKLPLRLSALVGAGFILLSVLVLGGGTIRALFASADGFSTTLILSSLYLLGGFTLLALGLVGEYVGRIYEQVKGRPNYLLKFNSDWNETGSRD